MSEFTKEINVIINNTNAYHKGEVMHSFAQMLYLIGKQFLKIIKLI